MIPLILAAISMAQKKAQNEQNSIDQLNQANTQNLLAQNNQQQQMPQFNTDMNKLFHS